MRILLSNDDGIKSLGILASKKAVESLGETIVVAPQSQQSAIGRALTLFKPLRINPTKLKDGSKGYAVTGTPADSVTLGIFELSEKKPDLMISGINLGENVGKGELTTSGTIGAAMEAASFGIPTIAISQQVTRGDIKFDDGTAEIDYDLAKKILLKIAKNVLDKGMPKGCDVLNINIPSNPDSSDIAITKLGKRMYMPVIETRFDPRGKPYYWIGGAPYEENEQGTDGYLLKVKKQPTITPISLDLTSNLKSLDDWI
ncbi:5'/3'-nucleotidase SurE [Methanobrevibacter filiformis]|uniref:5'-nucleotidase SurE n=1 Tax=Methanobrevibacter filiformis TaxID=55758 RepID=A0A166EVF5_9EURY|nr:5'/3'-nucleotidase SurE [Methanobrevibacter filiformis]KZX17058.1 5'-nucleotidase SurE [Methanobrevibacter filiformis]